MPLDEYGVLSGTLHRHFRDQPDTLGRWFHVNLEVDAPTGRHRCAVDVDSKQSATGVQWKVFTLDASALGPVAGLTPGYHDLARTPGSGALDFLRHPALANRPGCVFVSRPPDWLQAILDRLNPPRPWISGSNLDAAQAFEPMLVPGRAILIFGEPFQDWATMTRREDGRLDVFLSMFSSQADRTDAEGHPA